MLPAHIPPAPILPWQIPPMLRGQVALVTGGSSGIGQSIAVELARAGASVVVNYHGSEEKAAAVVAEIEQLGGRAFSCRADVSQEGDILGMFAEVRERFGTVDILINNAGLQADAPLCEMTLAQWERVIQVNLTGQFLCAREAVREFRRRGLKPEISHALGKIICISSVHEVIPWAGHVNYASSKGGIAMLMKSIAQEVAAERIRVNSIAPGAIRTPINTAAWDTPEHYNALLTLIPVKRIAEPEEIGRAAAWLASDAADYIHGTTLFIDGGMTLYPGFESGG
jgi:glucose 1-dehydrogenase